MKNEYADVALDQIELSTTNKMFRDDADFTPAALQDLIDSILKVGVLSPILLRPGKKKKYELVCGERRYRASLAVATLDKKRNMIAASIRDLKDDEALEAQVVENLQRENINPMKEAAAFEWMTKAKKLSASEIADRIGKSADYVQERIKLTTLSKDAQELIRSGVLPLKAGLKIARIPEQLQGKALQVCTDTIEGAKGKQTIFKGLSSLQWFMSQNVFYELAYADFDTSDPDLLHVAGSCVGCPKRTSNTAGLFDDIAKKDYCFDSVCFKKKQLAHYDQIRTEVQGNFPGAEIVYRSRGYYSIDQTFKKLTPVVESYVGTEIPKSKAQSELQKLDKGHDPKIKVAILIGIDRHDGENSKKKYICLSFEKPKSSGASGPSRPSKSKAQLEKERTDAEKRSKINHFEEQFRADAIVKKGCVKILPDSILRMVILTFFEFGEMDEAALALNFMKVEYTVSKGFNAKVPKPVRSIEGYEALRKDGYSVHSADLEKALEKLKGENLNALLLWAQYTETYKGKKDIEKILKVDSRSISDKAKKAASEWWKKQQAEKAAAAKAFEKSERRKPGTPLKKGLASLIKK